LILILNYTATVFEFGFDLVRGDLLWQVKRLEAFLIFAGIAFTLLFLMLVIALRSSAGMTRDLFISAKV
jgi:hypothetical protein